MEVSREPVSRGGGGLRVEHMRARDLLRGPDLEDSHGTDVEEVDLERHVEERLLFTRMDRAFTWARANSLFPLTFGLA